MLTLNRLMQSVQFTGGIGVVGVFPPQAPDAHQNFDEHNDGWTKVCRTQTTLTGKGSVRRARRGQVNTSHRMDRIMAGELIRERIAILAADGVERVELEQPRQALHDAGATTELLSLHEGEIQARNNDLAPAGTFPVEALVKSASVDDYDALLLAQTRRERRGRSGGTRRESDHQPFTRRSPSLLLRDRGTVQPGG